MPEDSDLKPSQKELGLNFQTDQVALSGLVLALENDDIPNEPLVDSDLDLSKDLKLFDKRLYLLAMFRGKDSKKLIVRSKKPDREKSADEDLSRMEAELRAKTKGGSLTFLRAGVLMHQVEGDRSHVIRETNRVEIVGPKLVGSEQIMQVLTGDKAFIQHHAENS